MLPRRPIAAGITFALALATAVPATAAPLKVEASMEEERSGLRVRVTCPDLPVKSIVTVHVLREFVTATSRPPVTLLQAALPFERAGEAEQVFALGLELQIPGRYRVKVAFPEQGQYPDVLKAIGDAKPEPAEVVLSDWMVTKDFLQAAIREQGLLADSFLQIDEYLRRMYAFEAGAVSKVPAESEKALAEWNAWRGKANGGVEALIQRGRESVNKFYPQTYQDFAESFVFAGLYQAESRKYGAKGQPHHETGTLKGKSPDQVMGMFQGLQMAFRKEAVQYRLVMMNGLYGASSDEASAQGTRPDPARWDRRRKEWTEILALWGNDLGQEGPPEVREMLLRKDLAALSGLVTAWWDAEEAKLFHPEKPEAAERDQRKDAVKAAAKAIQAKLEAP